MTSLADNRSVVPRFATGDKDTLLNEPRMRGDDTVAALRKYYDKFYCPPHMRVALVGPLRTSEMFDKASSAFSDIKTTGEAGKCRGPVPTFATPNPWPEASLGKWIEIEGTTAV